MEDRVARAITQVGFGSCTDNGTNTLVDGLMLIAKAIDRLADVIEDKGE